VGDFVAGERVERRLAAILAACFWAWRSHRPGRDRAIEGMRLAGCLRAELQSFVGIPHSASPL
jgi:hypothetical protein